jgi:hypothetical protein
MTDVPLFANGPCAERYLMSVSPEAVFDWFMVSAAAVLKKEYRPSFASGFDEALMRKLLSRQEPIVDLAIATYCDNASILETLWGQRDRTIQLAIADNGVRRGLAGLPTSDFEQICNDADLVKSVFSSPTMEHEGLTNFLTRSEMFQSLSEDAWLRGLYYAVRNPILKTIPKEERFSDDGFQDYMRGRPFDAAWKLLIFLESTGKNAALLSDAYLNIAVFSPPYGDLLEAEGKMAAPSGKESHAEFAQKLEHGTRLFLEYVFYKWCDTNPPKKGDDKWPSDRGFIRQGVAAGAARKRGHNPKDGIVYYLRDHPDKWVRAGFYMGFRFWDEVSVQAAYEKDGAFFAEQAVFNKVLYQDTPAARSFRALVGRSSGREWKDFSDDQLRRRIYDGWAMRLWRENPAIYFNPEDDLDALNPPAPEREADESLSAFLYRRAEQLKNNTYARESQIATWLKDAPDGPQRIVPLVTKLVATLHGEMQTWVHLLAEEAERSPQRAWSVFGGRGK